MTVKNQYKRLAVIGRPGIGGEFLDVAVTEPLGRYQIRRFRQMTSDRAEPRQLGDIDLPASTMIYDLLSAIEGVAREAQERGQPLHLDDHGLAGDRPSIKDRLVVILKTKEDTA